MNSLRITRRSALKGLGALTAAGAASRLGMGPARAQVPPDAGTDPRFLIVLTCSGGASIIDGPLAIAASQSANAATINAFPDQVITRFDDSPLVAVDMARDALGQIPVSFTANQSNFVRRHRQDMMVATWTRTSVNHGIGQRRAVTGNEAWLGRTLQEATAWQHGAGFALPNVHLTSGSGYTARGGDESLPTWCFGEVVADPKLWPLALDGARGLPDAPSTSLLNRARALRDTKLDPGSRFARVFGEAPRLQHWQAIRGERRAEIERRDLISKLMFMPDTENFPLAASGLMPGADAERVRAAFPFYDRDPLHAQAALAFLLLKHRVSVTVTLGPSSTFVFDGGEDYDVALRRGLPPDSIRNPPIAFDFSHQGHRSVQALMWHRMYEVAGGLIELLKGEEWANGQSLWDRSLIYFASDFGRDKRRPANADDWGTGHDLNNGVLLISPLVQGNRVLGGVDEDTGHTYGFNPSDGTPDRARNMEERDLYAGILQSLGVDTSGSGLPDVPAMRRA